jgi:hypothetical protein
MSRLILSLLIVFLSLAAVSEAFSLFSSSKEAKEFFVAKAFHHGEHGDERPHSLWGFLQGPPPDGNNLKNALLAFPVKGTVSRALQRADNVAATHPLPDTASARKTISVCRDLLDQADKWLDVVDNPAQFEEFLKSYPPAIKYLIDAWKNKDIDSLEKAISVSSKSYANSSYILLLIFLSSAQNFLHQ